MNIDEYQLAFFIRESLKNIKSTNKKNDIDLSDGRYYLVVHQCDYINAPTHILGITVIVTHYFMQDDYILCCRDPNDDELLFLREFEEVRNVY